MAPPLATLAEEPGGGEEEAAPARRKTGLHAALHRWARARIPLRFLSGGGDGGGRPSADLRVLLSVLACPLSPFPVLPRHPRHVASSAQYIIEQFRATTGCAKIEGAVKSMYAAGRVRMVMASGGPRILPQGAGPGDDRVGVLGGGARRREAGGRRGLLRAAHRRGAVGAVELERWNGGGDPARHDGLLQPAERPAGAARGLAAHPHPDSRCARHVLGDHRLLPRRRLPRRRRPRLPRGRARRQLSGAPGTVRRRRRRGARGDADGGGVDHRRRRVQRRRPLPGVLHRAGGGQEEPPLRHHLQVIFLI